MNSKVSPNPKPDNNDFDQSTNQPEESAVEAIESNSKELTDVWLDESPSNLDNCEQTNEDIEVEIKSITETTDSEKIELETIEAESGNWLEDEEEENIEQNSGLESSKSDLESVSSESWSDSSTETELFTDRWLDEPQPETEVAAITGVESEVISDLTNLKQQKDILSAEITALKAEKEAIILQQAKQVQETLGRFVEEGMKELKERKNTLQIEIEKLERRRERIRQEMRTTFAGSSQELAIRVQGFKDYLVGSLQDLAVAAEKLELSSPVETRKPARERIRD